MLRLEKVNGKNIWDILKLRVPGEQEGFVAGNDISIIEAYIAITANGHAFPFGVYAGDTPVGFLMVGFGADDDWEDAPGIARGNYNLWRLMIDQRFQDRGYGREALRLALEFIRTFPCGPAAVPFLWVCGNRGDGRRGGNRSAEAVRKGKKMEYTIERAKLGDEETLAYIQTESWKAGFREILDEQTLQSCTQLDKATAMYRRLLEAGIGNGYLLRVEGSPHCIAWWDATREKDMPGYAELICIHSLQDRWRMGYGSRMMETVLRDAAAAGYKKIMLWVFEGNTCARRFYEANGFAPNGKTQLGLGAAEVCYERTL